MMRADGAAPLRIAIVGLGPKGMYALERLLDRIAIHGASRAVQVDAFEPHQVAGAGPVYDPAQPEYLRMNFSADQVAIWPAGSQAVPGAERRTFTEWQARHADRPDPDPYVPRAQVGRYLSWGLSRMLRHAPPRVEVSIRRARVTEARPSGAGWQVRAGASTAEYDEVILATGHAEDWTGALRHDWPHRAALVESVFPVERRLGSDRVPNGSAVAVRGFALTFIDAALALTEGRGGSFIAAERGRLRYQAAGAEPARILPFSRSGRPMLAKPVPGAEGATGLGQRSITSARGRILALRDGFSVDRDLSAIVEELALSSGPDRGDPARGAAWRAVYPAIVERLGGDGLEQGQWPAFRVLAAEMERLAFGPPPLNAAKLRALIDAGIVDLAHVSGGWIESSRGPTELCSAAGRASVDVVIDAVLPPPGAIGLGVPLLDRLLGDGHARVRPARRGLEVGPDSVCVAADGGEARGLAACGRPTEDWVIGNDTLSRALHPQLDRWAERVAGRIAATAAGVAERSRS